MLETAHDGVNVINDGVQERGRWFAAQGNLTSLLEGGSVSLLNPGVMGIYGFSVDSLLEDDDVGIRDLVIRGGES